MKKVSIIGLGWLGLPLANYLAHNGWLVKGSKRSLTNIDGIETFRFCLGEPFDSELGELLRAESLVINIPPCQSNAFEYVAEIKRLVQAAILQNVRHLLFVSTTGVFPQKSGVFDESCTELLENSTVAVERYLQTLPIHCDIVRLAGLIGKNRHPVHSLAGRSNLKNGGQPVNLVHQQDVIRAIALLLQTPNQQRLFHLCASQHPSRAKYYATMAKKFGLPDLQFEADNTPLVRLISANKICDELGFHYQFNDPFLMPID